MWTATDIPSSFNLAEYVLRAGQSTPRKTALEILGHDNVERWSYARLTEAVLGTANGLIARGLKPGDRVLLPLETGADSVVTLLALFHGGQVPATAPPPPSRRTGSAG